MTVKKLWWNPHDPNMEKLPGWLGKRVTSSPYFILYENGEVAKSGYGFPDEQGSGMEDFLEGFVG